MFRFLLVTITFLCVIFYSVNAQEQHASEKKYNHYVGLQANELLRQLFNLSNNNTAVNNPYLLVYSINNKSGWGLNAGIGLNYSSITDKLAPASRNTQFSNLSYRVGVEKKFILGNKFFATAGIDVAMRNKLEKTTTLSIVDFGSEIDSSKSTITNKTTGLGFGPSLKLGFNITDRIILGTEATFYYFTESAKENILLEETAFQVFQGLSTTTITNSNSEVELKSFSITAPVSIFLTVKF